VTLHVPPLSGIAGQERAVRALRALAADEASLPPLLLHGPDGVGKRTTALAFAAALVCRAPRGGDACGECLACRRVAAADEVTRLREKISAQDSPTTYPDVGYVSIAGSRTRISVLQARDIATSLASRPFELSRRLYVIDPADALTVEAANALLKVLEELPAHGALVLVTTAPWALPITVRSRVRAIRFGRLGEEILREHLVDAGVEEEEIPLRIAAAGGSLGEALALDTDLARRRRDAWVETLARLAGGEAPGPLAVGASQAFGESAGTAETALEALLAILRDVAAGDAGTAPRLLSEEQARRLQPFADTLLGPARERVELIDRLRADLKVFHLNAKLVVEGSVMALAGRLRQRDLPPR
jgi:DNA polymerase-3 subunit delta'